jgi:hypothetical protein
MTMTTMTNTKDLDLTQAGDVISGESLWSRIFGVIEHSFNNLWGFLNEDMGRVDVDGDGGNFPNCGGCC